MGFFQCVRAAFQRIDSIFVRPSDCVENEVERLISRMLSVACLGMSIMGIVSITLASFTWDDDVDSGTMATFVAPFVVLLAMLLGLYFLSRSRYVAVSKYVFTFLMLLYCVYYYFQLASTRSAETDQRAQQQPASALYWCSIPTIFMTEQTRFERFYFHFLDCMVVISSLLVGVAYTENVIQFQDEVMTPLFFYVIFRTASWLRIRAEAKMATKVSETKNAHLRTQLFSSLNHDIRTHLSGIMGSVDIMRSSNSDSDSDTGNGNKTSGVTVSNVNVPDAAADNKVDQQSWSQEMASYLDTCWNSCQSLLSLVNDLLDFQKMQTGKFAVTEGCMDLIATIRHVERATRPSAEKKGLFLTVSFDQSLPQWIVLDKVRFEQVLLNLLSNAVKFTSHGGVTLTIKSSSRQQSTLEVTVEDTGPGISPEEAANLFQPFHQLQNGKLFGSSGAGLGLCICKDIVTACRGKIEVVRSEPCSGAKFQVVLPLKLSGELEFAIQSKDVNNMPKILAKASGGLVRSEASLGSADSRLDPVVCLDPVVSLPGVVNVDAGPQTSLARVDSGCNTASTANASASRRVRVLLAEDNAINTKILLRMFKQFPHIDVTSVENGKLAVEAFLASSSSEPHANAYGETGTGAANNSGFDLVLLDMNMPVMGGHEACRQMKRFVDEHSQRWIPFVISSASDPKEIEANCRDPPFDHIAPKPLTLDVLRSCLAKYGLV